MKPFCVLTLSVFVAAGCCDRDGTPCSLAKNCCSNACTNGVCGACVPVGSPCSATSANCCNAGASIAHCIHGACCMTQFGPCTKTSDCCPFYNNFTQVARCDRNTHTCTTIQCVPVGKFCSSSPDEPPCCQLEFQPVTCSGDPNLPNQCALGPVNCGAVGAPCGGAAAVSCCRLSTGGCNPATHKCDSP